MLEKIYQLAMVVAVATAATAEELKPGVDYTGECRDTLARALGDAGAEAAEITDSW
ncbi:MAG: hypothetical protein V3V61_06415 [Gammaproteobacteria bacterium]